MRLLRTALVLFFLAAPVYATDYRSVILADGAQLFWRLDEASGDFVDQLTSASCTASVSGITYSQTGLISDGSGNKSAKFDGVAGDCRTPGAVTNTLPGTTNSGWSIEAWYKPTAIPLTGHTGPIASRTNRAGYAWQLYAREDSALVMSFYGQGTLGGGGDALCENGTQIQVAKPGVLTVGTRSHVVVTTFGETLVEGWGNCAALTRVKLYVNGYLADSSTSPDCSDSQHSLCKTGYPMEIAHFQTAAPQNDFANGTIDELSFYTTELTAAQVLCHWHAGNGVPCRDWPMTAMR